MPFDIGLKAHPNGYGADILISGQVVGQIHFVLTINDNLVNVILEPSHDSEYKLHGVQTTFGESGRTRSVLVALDKKPRPISLEATHHLGQELTQAR